MNATNRGLNRLFLAITGLLLIAAGAVPLALALVPAVASQWRATAKDLASGAPAWVAQPTTGKASALVLGVAVVAVILVLLLLVFMIRRGGGRTGAAIEHRGESGTTRIDLAVPRSLLEEHLGSRDEFAGVRIASYEVRGTPMLAISARCRRGVSPAAAAELIGRAVTDLERILGTDVPTLVRLSGGFRLGRAPARAV
ncbi:hypothetical protein [Amnibacterium setariae]|uniref:Alkaline shock response membrane anchor protein AmaP n=1 Tax=Amnibacterium setariae TaxID=2306585 RepID=A0A3A1TU92_9MICO|nr:hypothetical protein [Amnibacterium setariae]RIX26494.1 hypothetical protein D1781_16290 [Amnibacterium setariae]